MRPHRRQPTRLPYPWDSPGKNTGLGCHFLLQCMKVKSESEVAQSFPTQRLHGLQRTRLLCPWDFPGKSTGVGRHCLLLNYAMLVYIQPIFFITKSGAISWLIFHKHTQQQNSFSSKCSSYFLLFPFSPLLSLSLLPSLCFFLLF